MASLSSILWASFGAFIASFGPPFFKAGAERLKLDLKSLAANYQLHLGIFFHVIPGFIFIYALKGEQLSVLYPIVSTTYVWVTIWAMIFFKEKINVWKWFGISLIILGVTLLGFGAA